MKLIQHDFDYVRIGSGFGGSVSALRHSKKGYKVLVIEKGKWYNAKDFAKTNWISVNGCGRPPSPFFRHHENECFQAYCSNIWYGG